MIELKPCPKCGHKILAKGQPLKPFYPRVANLIRSSYGVTCVLCGYHAPTIRAWNRRASHEE